MNLLTKVNLQITFVLLIIFSSCKPQQSETTINSSQFDELGVINLEVTGNNQAQKEFKTGLLLLHSFEYEDARKSFIKAQEKDSTMTMAYWGEAMTYNHSLWQKQEKKEALAALKKLNNSAQERIELSSNELEKDLMNAVNILYGEGTKYERDITYENFMSSLVDKHPGNHEVKAFHAISLLAASRNGRDSKLYNQSAQIAQGIIKENPNHPGALHYLIHAYDDPGHAHMAKTAADAYAKVAPDATHALHMPSHIYVALGLWDDVIKSNIASWNASVKKDKKSYHALHWLMYGFLQKGELANAKNMLDKMIQNVKDDSTKVARGYLNNMLGAYLVGTENWNDNIIDFEYNKEDLNLTTRASAYYIKGMKAFANTQPKHLNEIIGNLTKEIYTASLSLGDKTFAMCSSAGFSNKPPNQLDIDMCKIMENQLRAKLAIINNKTDQAIQYLMESSKKDLTLSYSYGPPVILKPVHEDLAELLLSTGQNEKAIEIFDRSLKRNPKRIQSLNGKLQAANSIKNQNTITSLKEELQVSKASQNWNVIL